MKSKKTKVESRAQTAAHPERLQVHSAVGEFPTLVERIGFFITGGWAILSPRFNTELTRKKIGVQESSGESVRRKKSPRPVFYTERGPTR